MISNTLHVNLLIFVGCLRILSAKQFREQDKRFTRFHDTETGTSVVVVDVLNGLQKLVIHM